MKRWNSFFENQFWKLSSMVPFCFLQMGKRIKNTEEARLMDGVSVENLEKYGWKKKKERQD